MQYESLSDLPEAVRRELPEHAQEIFRAAFNHAWDEYADPAKRRHGGTQEEAAFAVAWAAVEHGYAKGSDGLWHAKS